MSTRRRRQFFLSPENYGKKYVKKPKRTALSPVETPMLMSDAEGHNAVSEASGSTTPSSSPDLVDQNDPVSNSEPTLESRCENIRDCLASMDHLEGSSDEPGQFYKIFSKINRKQFQSSSNIEVSEIVFMVLNFYIRHGLTQSALEDLLKMLNIIAGVKTFPESFSSFLSLFQTDPYDSYRVYFCTNCQFDYGKNKPNTNTECPICKSRVKDFFIVIPVKPQIHELVSMYKEKIEKYAQVIEQQDIADVNRGRIARKVVERKSRACLTLSANTDGAAIYRCTTQKPLYPVFVTLNNLPPKDRYSKHNLIINAIWLSKGEPNTNLLFKYLCIELKQLQVSGIEINGTIYSIELLQVNLDSVARCKVQNMKQFNGNYGCTFCLHPGELKETGNSRCYPKRIRVPKRKDNLTRKLMDEVSTDGNEQLGVMGKTVFVSLTGFDVIESFPPDYMHAILLGVVKQLWSLWMESENHKQPFYIGNSQDKIEKRLLTFRPPTSFPRYPRQLQEYKKYKANEWEAILLHYMYPALLGILPQQYLDHVMLLSTSIFQLLDPKLNDTIVDSCENNLKQFVFQFESYYGKNHMSYNVHLISHLVQSVRNFGALYNFSLFPYESGNGMLLGFRTGNNKPILQIERKYYLNRMCQHTQLSLKSPINGWVQSLWTKQQTSLRFDPSFLYDPDNDIVYDADVSERYFSAYGKLYIKDFRLCSRDVCKEFNYDDSWIQMNGIFFNIRNILCDRSNVIYIVGQTASTHKIYENLFSFELCAEQRIMKVNDSIRQCIAMNVKSNDQQLVRYISICKNRTQVD